MASPALRPRSPSAPARASVPRGARALAFLFAGVGCWCCVLAIGAHGRAAGWRGGARGSRPARGRSRCAGGARRWAGCCRPPSWRLGLITCCVLTGGEAAGAYAALYVWVSLYAWALLRAAGRRRARSRSAGAATRGRWPRAATRTWPLGSAGCWRRARSARSAAYLLGPPDARHPLRGRGPWRRAGAWSAGAVATSTRSAQRDLRRAARSVGADATLHARAASRRRTPADHGDGRLGGRRAAFTPSAAPSASSGRSATPLPRCLRPAAWRAAARAPARRRARLAQPVVRDAARAVGVLALAWTAPRRGARGRRVRGGPVRRRGGARPGRACERQARRPRAPRRWSSTTRSSGASSRPGRRCSVPTRRRPGRRSSETLARARALVRDQLSWSPRRAAACTPVTRVASARRPSGGRGAPRALSAGPMAALPSNAACPPRPASSLSRSASRPSASGMELLRGVLRPRRARGPASPSSRSEMQRAGLLGRPGAPPRKVSAEHARAARRLRDLPRRCSADVEDLDGLAELADEDPSSPPSSTSSSRRVEARLADARGGAPVLRPLRRGRRAGHRQRRRRRHRRPGLGRDGAAHGDALGRAARLQGRAAGGQRGGGGRHQVGDVPRRGRERLRAVRRREGRPPAGAHLARSTPPTAARRRSRASRSRRSSRTPATSRSTTTTCRSTPTAPPAPAASTSTRPTPRCASPTGRPASSCSARTSARSRPTTARRR